MSSLHLWLSVEFSGKKEILRKKFFYILLLIFPLVLLFAQWNGLLFSNFSKGVWGWRPIMSKSVWLYIFYSYTIVFLGISLALVFLTMTKDRIKEKREQARIIFITMLVSIIGGTVFDVFLLLNDIYNLPNFTNFFGIIWAGGIVYAMARHKFMSFKPEASVQDINTPLFDCLILLDPQGVILSCNEATYELLGYTEEELRDHPLSLFICNEGNDGAETGLMQQIIGSESVRNREVTFKSKKGKKLLVNLSASVLMEDEGDIEGIVCIARDNTELKRTETVKDVLFNISEAVRKAITLRELLEIIQVQVGKLMDARNFYVALVFDKENALYTFPFIVDVNPEELEDPDIPVQLKNSFTDYVCRTQQPLLADKKKFDELLKREEIYLIGTYPMSWMGVPLKTAEDEVIGVVVIQSYSDESAYSQSDLHVLSIISNTIAGAVKYKQAEEALRASEEQYRSLINNIQDGVFLVYNRKLEFVNDAFTRMVGYRVEELIGEDFDKIVYSQDKEMLNLRYLSRLRGENPPAEYEFRIVHKNRSIVYVNMHVGLINYRDGTANMGTLKDITEKKYAEKERQELEEKLARSEKMEALGRLAGGVAHDLNNVLSAIVSYPDLLLMKLPGNSPLRKSIITMKQSGQRAAAIVQDLLTLARRGVMIKKTENLNQVVADYLSSPEFEKLVKIHPQVHYRTQTQKDLLNIKGSAIHLSKTVMNLIANAAEAMPNGGEVFISTENIHVPQPLKGFYHTIEKGHYVLLTVTDTGVGIAYDDLGKIFDPFYSKKEMGRSGTGLGMSVVWGTVEDHKGFIDVESALEKGTTFKLYFPVTEEENRKPDERIDTPINKYMGKGERILVVDDERDQREIASVLLTELGYSVQTVASGEEAINYFKTGNSDLILLDMIMNSGIDGLDTYKKILKLKPGTKAIITSGFSESDRVKEALRLGAGMYIRKPYTMEKIGMAVTGELKKR